MPHGTEPSRTTEVIAVRELPTTEQREYEAVRMAVEETERKYDGRDRLRLIKWAYWDNRYTLYGAAMGIPISYETAKRWQRDFIQAVAQYAGLMDKEGKTDGK